MWYKQKTFFIGYHIRQWCTPFCRKMTNTKLYIIRAWLQIIAVLYKSVYPIHSSELLQCYCSNRATAPMLVTRWRHRMEIFYALLALCEGIYRWPGDSIHKGRWRGALIFSLVCAQTNGLTNSWITGDMRHHDFHMTSLWWRQPLAVMLSQVNHTQYQLIQYMQYDFFLNHAHRPVGRI